MTLEVLPVTADRWRDVEALFRGPGDPGRCWCAWFEQRRRDFRVTRVADRKALLHARVARDEVPGLLAYRSGEPVGWVRVGPRASFEHLAYSRKLAAVDDLPVWSIVCFVVAPDHRRGGVMSALIDAAVAHAFARGAPAVEAYPVTPPPAGLPNGGGYEGVLSTFLRAGFVEVRRANAWQSIVRRSR